MTKQQYKHKQMCNKEKIIKEFRKMNIINKLLRKWCKENRLNYSRNYCIEHIKELKKVGKYNE